MGGAGVGCGEGEGEGSIAIHVGNRRHPIVFVPPQLVPVIFPFFVVLTPSYLQAPRPGRRSRRGRRHGLTHATRLRPGSSSPPRDDITGVGARDDIAPRAGRSEPPPILPRAGRTESHRSPPGLPLSYALAVGALGKEFSCSSPPYRGDVDGCAIDGERRARDGRCRGDEGEVDAYTKHQAAAGPTATSYGQS
jgi:hypothetical protein